MYEGLLLILFIIAKAQADYIVNGGFSLPDLGSGVLNGKFIDSWNVTWIDLKNEAPYMGFGQYVDLQKAVSQNGRIEQQVTLPDRGIYELNFYQRAKTTNYSLYRVQIYWNGALVTTKVANTTSITYESVMLVGQVGINVLVFQETGLDVDNHGMHIDQVSLNLVTAWAQNDTTMGNSSSLNSSANTTGSINFTSANTSSLNSTLNNTSPNSSINSTNSSIPSINSSVNTSSQLNTTSNASNSNSSANDLGTNNSTNTSSNVTNSSSSTNSTSLTNSSNLQNITNLSNFTNTTNNTNTTIIILPINTTSSSNYTNTTNLQIPLNLTHPINLNNDIVYPTTNQSVSDNKSQLLNDDGLYYLSIAASVLFSHTVCIRYGFLLLQDLWLYSYDDRNYNGVIKQVFNITTIIEQLKFEVLDRWLGWMQYQKKLPLSNYQEFSRKSTSTSSLILLQVLFPYFIYTFPQTICFCIVLYCIFQILKNSKYSQFIRRYSFFWVNLIQSLIEGNIAYFTYMYLGNLSISFSFTFQDKLALSFSIFFYFLILVYSCVFYFFIGNSLKQNAAYFISCYYRCTPAYNFLILNNLVKGVLRGSIFFFLSFRYEYQIIFRCLVQVLLIITTISIQKTYKIFMSQSMFSLLIAYESVFFALNICLYGEYQSQGALNEMYIQLQGILVYVMIGITFMRMILDFVPLQYLKPRCKNDHKNTNRKARRESASSKFKSSKQQLACFDTYTFSQTMNKLPTIKLNILKKQKPSKNSELGKKQNQKPFFSSSSKLSTFVNPLRPNLTQILVIAQESKNKHQRITKISKKWRSLMLLVLMILFSFYALLFNTLLAYFIIIYLKNCQY